MQHLIDIRDHSREVLERILERSRQLRVKLATLPPAGLADLPSPAIEPVLAGRTLAMLLQKPSLRTRVSFQVATEQLGGSLLTLLPEEVGLGKRESAADVARVLGRMVDGVIARVFDHQLLKELAGHAGVPVINALSDHSHPCQALADLLTIWDEWDAAPAGRHVVFVGDGNNVALSLAEICAAFGVRLTLACPDGFAGEVAGLAEQSELVSVCSDPQAAVADADVVYTDTWVSMGQEAGARERRQALEAYQVNEALMSLAPAHAIVMHCLPAHRGEEITDAVMDGRQSRVFDQAENRLHAQRGLLSVMFE